MNPDAPGSSESPSSRLPGEVDPIAEQERLEQVSGTRAEVYGSQAETARSLAEDLERAEAERRRLSAPPEWVAGSDLPPSALLDLTGMVRQGASLDELLQRVLEQSLRLFEALKAAILVPTEAGGELRLAAARSLGQPVREQFRMPDSAGVAGRVFTSGEPLVVPDTSRCDFWYPAERRPEPRYMVALPLRAEGETLGVLSLERPVELPASTERLEQLAAFCRHAASQLRNVRAYEQLRRQVAELSVLCDISRELSSSLDSEDLLQEIVESACKLLECGICSLMLFDDDKTHLRIRHAVGLPAEVIEQARITPGQGVAGWVAEHGEPLLIEDITTDERFRPRGGGERGKYSTRSLLTVPLTIGTEVVGVLNVNNKANNAVFTAHDLGNLAMLASQAAVSIENARLYETLQRLAVTDPLTKLFRRNYFEEQLTTELGRCQRYDRPLSLMMLDIDHFKSVNDTYGHPVGDLVLQGLAGVLRRYGRKDDVIARYGGEEFVAYLVETDEEGARLAAERVRQAAAAQRFDLGDGRELRITVSVGTASYPAAGDDGPTLVKHADLALYRAKRGGRNQVCQYTAGMVMDDGAEDSPR